MTTKQIQNLFKRALEEEGVHLTGKRPRVKVFQEGTVTFVYLNGRHNKFGWAKRTKGEKNDPRLGLKIAMTRLVRSMRGES